MRCFVPMLQEAVPGMWGLALYRNNVRFATLQACHSYLALVLAASVTDIPVRDAVAMTMQSENGHRISGCMEQWNYCESFGDQVGAVNKPERRNVQLPECLRPRR